MTQEAVGKIDVKPLSLVEQTVGRTVLVVTRDREGRPNAMTAGWLSIGGLWGKAVLTIAVRPDRYTYELLEAVPEFTLNVPGKELHRAVEICGVVSGRDEDKFKRCRIRTEPGRVISVPSLAGAVICYECKVILKAESEPIRKHRLYFGDIVAAYAAPKMAELAARKAAEGARR